MDIPTNDFKTNRKETIRSTFSLVFPKIFTGKIAVSIKLITKSKSIKLSKFLNGRTISFLKGLTSFPHL